MLFRSITYGEGEAQVTDTVTITPTAAGVKDYDASYSENNTYTATVTNESSYKTFTKEIGTLSIDKRTVTLTSESGEKPYDGTPLTKPDVTVGGDGIVGIAFPSELRATSIVRLSPTIPFESTIYDLKSEVAVGFPAFSGGRYA